MGCGKAFFKRSLGLLCWEQTVGKQRERRVTLFEVKVVWTMMGMAEGDRRGKVWDFILKVNLPELADEWDVGHERHQTKMGRTEQRADLWGKSSLALDVLILRCLYTTVYENRKCRLEVSRLETTFDSVRVQKVLSVMVLDEITRQVSVNITDPVWVSLSVSLCVWELYSGNKIVIIFVILNSSHTSRIKENLKNGENGGNGRLITLMAPINGSPLPYCGPLPPWDWAWSHELLWPAGC